jgi:hypothetical protein
MDQINAPQSDNPIRKTKNQPRHHRQAGGICSHNRFNRSNQDVGEKFLDS